MYYPYNGQRSYKPQTKHADRMILPSSSQKHLQTKAVIELLHTQDNIAFVIVAHFSLFVCKLARVVVRLAAVLRGSNTTPFWATKNPIPKFCTCTYFIVHWWVKSNSFIRLLKRAEILHFCLGTRVPRHSVEGVGMFVRRKWFDTYKVCYSISSSKTT